MVMGQVRQKPGRLGQHLDNKLIKYIEQLTSHPNDSLNPTTRYDQLSTSQVLEHVRIIDPTLRRKKNAELERSIDRALNQLRSQGSVNTEEGGEDQVDSDFEFDEDVEYTEVKDTNIMNKSIQKLWGQNGASSPARTATQSPALAPTVVNASETASVTSAVTAAEDDKKKRKARREDSAGVSSKKAKAAPEKKEYTPPTARLSDLGGVENCIEQVLELIAMPLSHPEVYLHTGVQPPRGILLHGPPGCGKTLLANAIAGEMGVPFINISAPSIVSGMSGESEKKIRDTFEEAKQLAPCLMFIDEIDAITPKRENAQREMEKRIVAQLLTCMDDLSWDKTGNRPVMIIAATNRPDALDSALRRAGRFDNEIGMGVPDEDARERILRVLSKKLRLSGDFDFRSLAKQTPGYVGADLTALTATAGLTAVKRMFEFLKSSKPSKLVEELEDVEMQVEEANATNIKLPHAINGKLASIASFLEEHPDPLNEEELEGLSITNADFIAALDKVQPSSKREGFATVPDVTWQDIGALHPIRMELQMAIVQPAQYPELFMRVGISAPSGVLLWGPPGCGKTLLAKAVANESCMNFISIKGPELLNKYVGESERAVRQVFARARASSPCVIFFDELDALVPKRDDALSDSSARVVNTLLTELDGLENRKQVYVIAATNRPDVIDGAMVRPGRLDKLLYVELPNQQERHDILKTLARKTPLAGDVDLAKVAEDPRCENYSGADLAALVREAAVTALRAALYGNIHLDSRSVAPVVNDSVILVTQEHFDAAFTKVMPSVSPTDRKRYDNLKKHFGRAS